MTVHILFGGASSERLVSVASAQNVSSGLPAAVLWFWGPGGEVWALPGEVVRAHRRPFEVPLAPQGPAAFPSLEAALAGLPAGAVVFNALHGGGGEDGSVQRLLEARGVAFTGSGSAASAAAFDKVRAKEKLKAVGARLAEAEVLPVAPADGLEVRLHALLARAPRWVLKPVADGSSHGLVHLKSAGQVAEAARTLAGLGVPYLAERFVPGRELTVSVVQWPDGVRALPVSEVRLVEGGAFDYAGKYLGLGSEEVTPAQVAPRDAAAAQQLAVLAHHALGCAGYSRTDMILGADGPVFLELNTLPGLTRASFLPQQLAAAGLAFTDFLEAQVAAGRQRAAG